MYEVVTKRIMVLDDLKKGLGSVRVMATSVTDLASPATSQSATTDLYSCRKQDRSIMPKATNQV